MKKYYKVDAMDVCIKKGKEFISLYEKASGDNVWSSRSKLVEDMIDIYTTIQNIIIKETNEPLSHEQMVDWFFTAGALVEDFLEVPNQKTIARYKALIKNILSSKDGQASITKHFVKN